MDISVMIKPASDACNLRCGYCFYHSLSSMRKDAFHGVMDIETAFDIIDKGLTYAQNDRFYLSFQGGEPLLAGKKFFIAVGEKLRGKKNVVLAVQTNGTLIDDEWCKIFNEYHYLVGISLDGTEKTCRYRVKIDGTPAFDDIMKGIELLQKNGVQFNVLTVLSKEAVNDIDDIYAFYKQNGFKYLQFIPCLKPLDGAADGTEYPTEEEYGIFLKKLFYLYFKDVINGEYTSIRQMDNFVRLARGERAEQCGMNGVCSRQFVIEGDGTVYPCDFYCLDKYELGNIKDTDFFALARSEKAKKFLQESTVVMEKCKKCDFFRMCYGGCKRERGDIAKCNAYKEFFKYALPYLRRIK